MEVCEQQVAHLEHLAEELVSNGLRAELVDKLPVPCLNIANADTPSLNERVFCRQTDDGSWVFWWPWQQPIGSVDDLATVVDKIALVLRSVEASG